MHLSRLKSGWYRFPTDNMPYNLRKRPRHTQGLSATTSKKPRRSPQKAPAGTEPIQTRTGPSENTRSRSRYSGATVIRDYSLSKRSDLPMDDQSLASRYLDAPDELPPGTDPLLAAMGYKYLGFIPNSQLPTPRGEDEPLPPQPVLGGFADINYQIPGSKPDVDLEIFPWVRETAKKDAFTAAFVKSFDNIMEGKVDNSHLTPAQRAAYLHY
ncbi:hypothetical protein ACJ72_05625 [Emergomyces africanus]|uniref:Uncharacterized protein n=1 Tax=Emergomyces africanus TaxID=1955775 RepID=A0A1B7NTD3_9EURO|nr:hypothetical protein ACJ72_05625 [Emergomyces africanus]